MHAGDVDHGPAAWDIDLAWQRTLDDERSRVFIRNPLILDVAKRRIVQKLARLKERLTEGKYHPDPARQCDIPKPGHLVRPGAYLTIADRIVYAAAVGECLTSLHQELGWAQDGIDYSYRLNPDMRASEWFDEKARFGAWSEFRKSNITALDSGDWSHVVMADITGYYENIDIGLLVSDLRTSGAPRMAVDTLSSCLNSWATVAGRGVPQGYGPSDVLAKFYLNVVDLQLNNQGFRHSRYVDDYLILCRNLPLAKRAIVELGRILRQRGLNLQSAKSEILSSAQARSRIDGITPVLTDVSRRYVAGVVAQLQIEDPYVNLRDAEEVIAHHAADPPLAVIRKAFRTHFGLSSDRSFDKTLFHFLLRRLAKQHDGFAVKRCVHFIYEHPQETGEILDYLAAVPALEDVEPDVTNYLLSDEAVYPYQVYQVLECYADKLPRRAPGMLRIARRFASDGGAPFYLRSVARRYVGIHGTAPDLEELLGAFRECTDKYERCEIAFALRRLEKGRRNAFYARWAAEGGLLKDAIELAKDV